MQNPCQDPIEYSQVRRQENSQNADAWKQADRDESSNSTSARKLVWEVNTKKDFRDMRISNHQHLTFFSSIHCCILTPICAKFHVHNAHSS